MRMCDANNVPSIINLHGSSGKDTICYRDTARYHSCLFSPFHSSNVFFSSFLKFLSPQRLGISSGTAVSQESRTQSMTLRGTIPRTFARHALETKMTVTSAQTTLGNATLGRLGLSGRPTREAGRNTGDKIPRLKQ